MNSSTLSNSRWDVVIIGAGPAGALAAVLCRQRGLNTLLVDKQTFPRHKVCGCCINGRGIELLQQSRVWPAIQSLQPRRLSALEIHLGNRTATIGLPASITVSRSAFDHALIQEAVRIGCRFAARTTAVLLPQSTDTGSLSHSEIPSDWVPVASMDSAWRSVELRRTDSGEPIRDDGTGPPSTTDTVHARVVLICDGLGHPSLHLETSIQSVIHRGARVGLGAVVDRSPNDTEFHSDRIQMVVGRHGYVGTVELEDGRLNVAAAIDPGFLSAKSRPVDALAAIFEEGGMRAPVNLLDASVRGTRPLTQMTKPLSLHRTLILGDAAGYVEPFTGEGIAWALNAAVLAAPLVTEVCQSGWTAAIATQWEAAYSGQISSRQRFCRLLSAGLQRPWLLHPMMTACQWFPSVTRKLVSNMNRAARVVVEKDVA